MIDLIAKRYVKALIIQRDSTELIQINNALYSIALACNESKVKTVIESLEISRKEKVDFLVSLNETENITVTNLINVLGTNKRLDILPAISKELDRQLSEMNSDYRGVIYTNKRLDDGKVALLEEKFSRKFDVKLSLQQSICDYDGIKVELDGLGLEISFSKNRLRTQMTEYILKAI